MVDVKLTNVNIQLYTMESPANHKNLIKAFYYDAMISTSSQNNKDRLY